MAALEKGGTPAINCKQPRVPQRPTSAMGAFSCATEDSFQWRSVCHTVVPELLQGAHTKKMLSANEGLPSIADQVLTTSLASIMRVAPHSDANDAWPIGTIHPTAPIANQVDRIQTRGRDVISNVALPGVSLQPLRSKCVAASKTVSMLAGLRARAMQNVIAETSKEEQLRKSNAKIEELQAHIKSLNVLLAAQENSRANAAAFSSSDCAQQACSRAAEQKCASNNGAVHTALVLRMEQLECSRDELKRQLTAFQDFAPVYNEILAILGREKAAGQLVAQTVRNIEHLFDNQRISGDRILQLQEKLEASENALKTSIRQKQIELAGKESEMVNVRNQLEQQRGLMLQIERQKDESVERRMQLESSMLQLKISLKLLAESWGCDISIVTEAEALVALLSQTMIGKSSAQDSLQVVQGVINTAWLEILHSRYPGTKLPGDAISGIRMMYESMKSLNLQNAQLSKHLKDAKRLVAEKQEELEKWKRLRASEVAHGRKVLELQGDIRKDACSQTDHHCKEIVVEQPPRTSQCAPELAQFVPPASTLAQAHPIKVPAFQMLSQDKATDVLGPPKWKRQLMAKARV